MEKNMKVAKHFSLPLMKQNIKSNFILTIVVTVIFCMITVVTCFAMSIMGTNNSAEKAAAQPDFYAHLSAMAVYNQMSGSDLSADDFMTSEDKTAYETAFEMMNAQSADLNLSVERLNSVIEILKDENGNVTDYVKQFEYTYALINEQGVFTGEDLSIQGMFNAMLSSMGISADKITTMAEMDSTSMLNKMYFTVMGLLPLLLFVVIVGNSLIVNQVDSGSMAYVLATPTKRSAVANTQAIFLIVAPFIICTVTCITRIIASAVFMGTANAAMNVMLFLGLYILIEAIAGICYMGSCIFNQSRKATAFGGGISVWFFIASLLGMFGSKDMATMGMGVQSLDIFNKLTLVGLFDIQSLSTIGTATVDLTFLWKFAILAVIAVATYLIGKFRFQKKDLPL